MTSEAQTRKERIDRMLRATGWDPLVPFTPGKRYASEVVTEYETANGPADYVLFDRGEGLAVVEAKKLAVGPQNVLEQAKRYSQGFQDGPYNFSGHRTPFAYSTNGEIIWFQDLRAPDSRSREVKRFHTRAALRETLGRDDAAATRWLQSNPIDNLFLRPYQKEAIHSIEQALAQKKRRMLVAMATGTGKTYTTIALIHRLMESGLARRVLFLVDRRALAAQAVGAMASFDAKPGLKFDKTYEVYSQRFRREDLDDDAKFDPKVLPTKYLTDPQPGNAFVYVCTIQRMRINLFGRPEDDAITGDEDTEEDAERLDIPIHAFDLIIADECHRGYTAQEESKWRETLEHFDAVKIGLTATPAAHTKAYFTDVVYRYPLERAIRDECLVDYNVVQIQSGIHMNGLFLREGEIVESIDTQTGRGKLDQLEDERQFEAPEIERKITSPDSTRKIVQEYLKYAREHEERTGRFPKTLVFAIHDLQHISHADQLVNALRDACGRGDAFVQKITGSPNVDRPLQKIRQFRNRETPAIVVTVDMLSTGVDIPKIEAILLVRPVKSRILFEQMLGRGTRLCDEIHKTHFTVFDALGVLDYFKKATDFTWDPPDKPARTTREVIEAIRNNQDRDYNTKILVRRLQRVAKAVSAQGREEFARYIPDGDIEALARDLPRKLEQERTPTLKLLTNPQFQTLLETYPHAPRTFLVARDAEDAVTSHYMFRAMDGRELKIEDYIHAFERFVRENPERVQALELLLKKPRGFHTRELTDLRKKLAARPEKFTEPNLRRAYQRELADIISMVKHAATQEPLLDAPQRVARAMNTIRRGRTFTPGQEKWLALIEAHLAQNLLVEKEDFEGVPFSRHGGWKRANTDFHGKLEDILTHINEAMVA